MPIPLTNRRWASRPLVTDTGNGIRGVYQLLHDTWKHDRVSGAPLDPDDWLDIRSLDIRERIRLSLERIAEQYGPRFPNNPEEGS
jgi:hypothetical protein